MQLERWAERPPPVTGPCRSAQLGAALAVRFAVEGLEHFDYAIAPGRDVGRGFRTAWVEAVVHNTPTPLPTTRRSGPLSGPSGETRGSCYGARLQHEGGAR